MIKEQFIKQHLDYAELRWKELELGEQIINLTAEQRKAHNEVRLAKEQLEE